MYQILSIPFTHVIAHCFIIYLTDISLIKRYTGRPYNPFGNIKEKLREEMSSKVTLFLFVLKKLPP